MNLASKLMRFKGWANRTLHQTLTTVPEAELAQQRSTKFGSIIHTMNHLYVVEDIFKNHLLGQSHGYSGRNTDTPPTLAEWWQKQQKMDHWWLGYAEAQSELSLAEVVEFEFVDGGTGAMTRMEIIMHIANHNTYHRGFVGAMLNQIGIVPTPTDLPVFVRDQEPHH